MLGLSAFVFLVGLIDDMCNLKPRLKLAGQVVAAGALVTFTGLTFPWTPWPVVNIGITLFWLVGTTNAVNLIDNMDGLAAGVCAIAAALMGVAFFATGQMLEGLFVEALAAVLAGFLVYNFNPASIFMGDCGSLFIGFVLASAALLRFSRDDSPAAVPAAYAPVFFFAVPILDTTLVSVMRTLAGRAITQGGRDHSSHRLVALGLSERTAVGVLYFVAAIAGLAGILVPYVGPATRVTVVIAAIVLFALLAIRLAAVRAYEEQGPAEASGPGRLGNVGPAT